MFTSPRYTIQLEKKSIISFHSVLCYSLEELVFRFETLKLMCDPFGFHKFACKLSQLISFCRGFFDIRCDVTQRHRRRKRRQRYGLEKFPITRRTEYGNFFKYSVNIYGIHIMVHSLVECAQRIYSTNIQIPSGINVSTRMEQPIILHAHEYERSVTVGVFCLSVVTQSAYIHGYKLNATVADKTSHVCLWDILC